jgi:hypothetical protein
MRRLKTAVENTTKRAVTPGKQTNKQPVTVDGFNETRIFSTYLKKPKYQIPLKSVQWKTNCFLRTDG